MSDDLRLYVASSEGSISWYRFDTDNGNLVFQDKIRTDVEVSFLCVSPDKTFMYAAQRDDAVRDIASYTIDTASGRLSFVNKVSVEGARPVHLSIDKTGKFIFQANFNGGNFSLIPINADGSLSDRIQTFSLGENPHQIKVDEDNKNVYITHMGGDFIAQYVFDDAAGKMIPNTPHLVSVKSKTGPRHFDFHPNKKWVYVINELNNTITMFNKNANGALEEAESYPALSKDFRGNNKTADLHIHQNGKYLYGSNRGDDSIAVFSINQSNGKITLAEVVKTGGEEPRNFTIDPTGNYLIVGNRISNEIVVFKINEHTGKIKKCAGPYTQPLPICHIFVD
jgi:6-phosphogluconolactonase